MKKFNLAIILFPSIIMFLITVAAFSNMKTNFSFDWKGLFIISLILGFPILFLIQGVASAISKINILLSLGISALSFLGLLIIYLNDSALVYILVYLIVGVIGYGIGIVGLKVKSRD